MKAVSVRMYEGLSVLMLVVLAVIATVITGHSPAEALGVGLVAAIAYNPGDPRVYLLEAASPAAGMMVPPGSFAGYAPPMPQGAFAGTVGSPTFAGWSPDFAGWHASRSYAGGPWNPDYAGAAAPLAVARPAAAPPNFNSLLASAQMQHAAQAAAAQMPVYTMPGATKKRTWTLGWASSGNINVGSTQDLIERPLSPAKVRRLSTVDTGFLLSNFRSGMDNQSLSSTGILSDTLVPNAVDSHVEFDVVGNGYPVTFTALNTTRNDEALPINVTGYCEAIN